VGYGSNLFREPLKKRAGGGGPLLRAICVQAVPA
jgi:hypothetical protein